MFSWQVGRLPKKRDPQMEAIKEKRIDQRYKIRRPMNLYRMDHQDQSYYAEMNDYSHGGLSIATNEKLVIGQLVYLELQTNNHKVTLDKNVNYGGIVRWAKSYPSTNNGTNGLYKYGVEYSKPIQASLN